LPGERNPQSAAEEFAPPPQGESVLDASMMAELIVTKKEIGPQLQKSAGTSRARPKSPGAGDQRLPLAGRLGAEHLILWFRGSGALLVAGFAASVRTPVEGKSGAGTAVWAEVIQGHSQERRHGKRQRSGHAGLDMACSASVQPGGVGMSYIRTPANGAPKLTQSRCCLGTLRCDHSRSQFELHGLVCLLALRLQFQA